MPFEKKKKKTHTHNERREGLKETDSSVYPKESNWILSKLCLLIYIYIYHIISYTI